MHPMPEDIDILNSLKELRGLPEIPRDKTHATMPRDGRDVAIKIPCENAAQTSHLVKH
jgi:hypothetical protein